jgi:hypothetical protein
MSSRINWHILLVPKLQLGPKITVPKQELGNEQELSSPGRCHGVLALFVIKADGFPQEKGHERELLRSL